MTREVRQRILIVDDEKDIVQVLEFALKQAGFETITAGDAAQAFARVRETQEAAALAGRHDVAFERTESSSISARGPK